MKKYYLIILFLSLIQMQGAEKLHGERILRHSTEKLSIPPPVEKGKKSYPWDHNVVGGYPRITKDFFRCKGNFCNPIVTKPSPDGKGVKVRDCVGGLRHGLCRREGKEFIYPCFLELLNHVQDHLQKRVVITTGYRCQAHQNYADFTTKTSKHTKGAEVDFYVEGLENQPEVVIEEIQRYYQQVHLEMGGFTRKNIEKLRTPAWVNKELQIALYQKEEGRDFDNSHSYPYISLQLLFDRERKEKIR